MAAPNGSAASLPPPAARRLLAPTAASLRQRCTAGSSSICSSSSSSDSSSSRPIVGARSWNTDSSRRSLRARVRCRAAPAGSGDAAPSSSRLYVPGGRGGSAAAAAAAAAAGAAALDAASCSVTPTGWHPLDTPAIWKGTEEQAVFRQDTPYPLTPSWKVILLSDGSVTRHLQLMTNQRVEVECLEMRGIGHERAGLPPAAAQIDGPLVQRQVLLHIPEGGVATAGGGGGGAAAAAGGGQQAQAQAQAQGRAYVYATSWWNADTVDQYLRDKSQPIWVSLSEGRTELYREILQLEHGNCPYLEQRFGAAGPFWGRQYLFWHGRRPLTLIYEVFSTALEELLGPARAPE